MAKISKGISEHDIEHASNWYLSNENLIEANDKIIAFTEQLDIVKLFKNDKNKNHTASDGQKFNISVDSLNAGYSFITPPINNLNYVIILDGKNRRKKIITKRVV